ncbi:hypothetical protein LCGC14_1122990 [marine sediment metagenome]|uniref:Uncharacterized protein n=1 Tax=marine sediment metagenome TaxID=412755 RepID=A0A0F9Q994_9ZZZZ
MLDKYRDWLNKLKTKYREELSKINQEEYHFLITNYRFEDPTLLFIFNFKLKQYDLTILIVNHNSNYNETCKYFGTISDPNSRNEEILRKLTVIIDENEELQPIKNVLLDFFKRQIKKERKPKKKGKNLGGGTIGRDSWYHFEFEGKIEDISIEDFFSNAIKEAKQNYQKKKQLEIDIQNREMSVESIEMLKITDNKVKIFLKEARNDLEKIKRRISDEMLQKITENSIIIENGALEKFGFVPEDLEACKILGELIPIENLTIQGDLDSRRFILQVRGLYGNLIEEILQEYINNPGDIEDHIINKLNELVSSYKTGKIPYKILLPITGIKVNLEKKDRKLKYQFSENIGLQFFDNILIITKNSDFFLQRSINYTVNNTEEGISRSIAIFGTGFFNFKYIERNKFLFNNKYSEPKSINNSEVWIEIKKIFSSFILSNFEIGYSKQFYEFPWWIPQRRYTYDFPMPIWLKNVAYYNPSEKSSTESIDLPQLKWLVPDSYRKVKFLSSINNNDVTHFTHGNISNGIGFFNIIQKSSSEMGYREISLKIPSKDFEILKKTFKIYTDTKYPINFFNNSFIIELLIRLRLREKIEDAILDSCLILESLLISGKEELSYQFRLHSSLLISNNFKELKENLMFFKNLYKLRSTIIHGGNWKVEFIKFINKFTKWDFSKSEWNYELIEFTRDDLIGKIFRKILKIIIRINEIGLSYKDIKKPYNLIARLKFNPLNIKQEDLKEEKINPQDQTELDEVKKLEKNLKRIKERLNDVIKSENLEFPMWYDELNKAINQLEQKNITKFQQIFCSLEFMKWRPNISKINIQNQKIIKGILNRLEEVKKDNS